MQCGHVGIGGRRPKEPAMRKRSLGWALVVALAIGGLALWAARPGRVAAEEKAPAPAAAKPSDTAAPPPAKEPSAKASAQEAVAIERVEKQIASVRDKLAALQSEEMEVSVRAQQILLAGSEKVKDVGNAGENLFNSRMEVGLAEYKQAVIANLQMWQAFGEKVDRLLNVAKGLERNRERVPKSLRPKIQEIVSLVEVKYRSIVLKMADLYERLGDYRKAVIFYRTALELLPEKARYEDKGLVLKMATLLDKLKEFQAELQLMKAYAAANPNDAMFTQKINEMEKKYGAAAPAAGGRGSGRGSRQGE